MSEWKPIETAPKEDVEILGYQATPGDFEGRQAVCRQWSEGVWIAPTGLMPTHWMPLPDPPPNPRIPR